MEYMPSHTVWLISEGNNFKAHWWWEVTTLVDIVLMHHQILRTNMEINVW